MTNKRNSLITFTFFLSIFSLACLADGVSIGKIYDPYVELLETEIEYEVLFQDDDDPLLDGKQLHKIGVGKALSDRWSAELSLIGEKTDQSNLDLEAIEFEVKYQLSEQGELNNDWGLLFELEKYNDDDVWEAGGTLIITHQWARWVGAINASLIYEWGDNIEDEVETSLASQIKYRHSAAFEPTIEYFKSENTNAIGPVILGLHRLGNGHKLRWETGLLFGLDNDTADTNFKLSLEYEF